MFQRYTDEILDHKGHDGDETQLNHTVTLGSDSVLTMDGKHKCFVYGNNTCDSHCESKIRSTCGASVWCHLDEMTRV